MRKKRHWLLFWKINHATAPLESDKISERLQERTEFLCRAPAEHLTVWKTKDCQPPNNRWKMWMPIEDQILFQVFGHSEAFSTKGIVNKNTV